MKKRLRKPSPALVISLIALFVALGGTTYAATSLPKNSVGTKQLKNNAVTGTKIASGAVTASKINTNGLTVPNAAHATSADSAMSATNATNATNASTATNATELGGLGPNSYQKVPTTTQHYTIPGPDLIPSGDGTGHSSIYDSAANQWCSSMNGSSFTAPIHLPNGAVITGWTVDYVDDSGTPNSNGRVYVTRFPLLGGSGTYDDLGVANLSDTATQGAAATASPTSLNSVASEAIDNSKWSYIAIGFDDSAGALSCSIDIHYTIPPGFAGAAPQRDRNQALGTGTRKVH